ncbi:hypothetical protein EBBID32_970 [Sphingobium indicum BiD32]|uniref:Uncharacterized protein n=1 Tax=Sphingobium indicum BiD32 TaxID=1301087 RepID=N1MG81_9SPHN|nr:hypothetical protein EBBID32_970 [Sphingobium indicum BiD32]
MEQRKLRVAQRFECSIMRDAESGMLAAGSLSIGAGKKVFVGIEMHR